MSEEGCLAIVVDNTISTQHVADFFASCTAIPTTAWSQSANVVLVECVERLTFEQYVTRTRTLQQQYGAFRYRIVNQ